MYHNSTSRKAVSISTISSSSLVHDTKHSDFLTVPTFGTFDHPFTVNMATVPECVPQMGNPVSEPISDPHVHFRPEDSPTLPHITITEPEGIFTLELGDNDDPTTSDSDSATSVDSDEDFGDYINDEYRLTFLELFARVPISIRHAIGNQRVLQCFSELTSTIRRVPGLSSTTMTEQIVDLLDTLPAEDTSLLCTYQ